MELAGATAVVTGGGSGIGRASALAFADAGASVFVADIAEDAGRETVGLIEKESGRAAFSRVDVTDPDQLSRMLDEAEQVFGGVDIVHNKAGIVCGEPHWPATDPDTLLRQVTINLGAGTYGGQTLSPPAGVTVIITASNGGATFVGHSPALTVSSFWPSASNGVASSPIIPRALVK